MAIFHPKVLTGYNDPHRLMTSTEIYYFSNPSVNYNGVATGATNSNDNARTLRETKHHVAGYRSAPVTSYTLTINSNNPSSGVAIESISGQPGITPYTHSVPEGTNVTLTAPEFHGSGADRKQFSSWSGPHTGTNPTITFTMSSAKTLTANYVNAPATNIFEENFDSSTPWPPTGWNRYQLAAETQDWVYDHFYESAYSSYSYLGNYLDNWLVSPQISLPASGSITLSFLEKNDDMDWYDYSGVLISTGNGNPSVVSFTELYESNSNLPAWTEKSINLSSYAGEEVYIAFNYQGQYAHYWWIDDVIISGDAPAPTGSIQVNIEPEGARTDGRWSLTSGDHTDLKTHNTTINLAPGNYTITFNNITGWTKPPDIDVNLSAGENAVETGTYTIALTAPTLVSPADNSSNPNSAAQFTWSAVTNANKYILEIRRADNNALHRYTEVGNVTSTWATGFTGDGTVYKWRVRAGNEHGWGPWSGQWNYISE